MQRTFKDLAVYSVKGGNKGATELVLAKHSLDAIEASDIRGMGETKATPIDLTPTFRQCKSGMGELMNDIEWYDAELKEWKCITVDESLYSVFEADILTDNELKLIFSSTRK